MQKNAESELILSKAKVENSKPVLARKEVKPNHMEKDHMNRQTLGQNTPNSEPHHH